MFAGIVLIEDAAMIRFQTIELKAAPKIAPQPRPTRTIVDHLADAICELASAEDCATAAPDADDR